MYDVVILGSGPAGLTAAIYTTRANLKTLIIAGKSWGGQLMLTTLVENYPGFPEGIQGPDLMMAIRKQAEKFETEIVDADFEFGDFTNRPFKVSAANGKTYEAKAVIIATGADTKWLGVPGEKGFIGHGVSSCGTCDAAFFRGKKVVVVGGGDTALEDAMLLTNFAKEVTIIHRRDAFRASAIVQNRVKANKKINFLWNTEVVEIKGADKVTGVVLKDLKSGKVKNVPIDGVFIAIGQIPNTTVLRGITLDEQGFIEVNNRTKTNVEGVFVAGDVHDSHYKQAITAAGMGCMAALDTERWLSIDNLI